MATYMMRHVTGFLALSATLLIPGAAAYVTAQAGSSGPLSIARQGYLFAGGTYTTVNGRQVMSGQSYVTPLVPRHVAATTTELVPQPDSKPLTCRQREVLQLVAEGTRTPAIAGRLHISQRTVENHRARLMRKLGLQNHSELVRHAVRHGLISLTE